MKSDSVIQTNLNTFVYCLFIFSGLIKAVLLQNLSFDLTFISAALCIVLMLVNASLGNISIHRTYLILIVALMVFYAWYVLSYAYSISLSYSRMKLINSFTNILAFTFPLFVRISFRFFTIFLVGVALLASLTSFYARTFFTWDELVGTYQRLYLYAGYITGYAVLMVYLMNRYFSFGKEKLVFFLIAVLLLTGARGPLIFCLGLMVIMIGTSYDFRRIKAKQFLSLIIGLVISLSALFYAYSTNEAVASQFDRTINRLTLLVDQGQADNSVNTRLVYKETALEMIQDRPLLGYGVGSYGIFMQGVESDVHPHNIVFELWAETGIIGLLLFLWFLLCCMLSLRRQFFVFGLLIFYGLLNALKSYSFEEHRVMFGFIAISVLLYKNMKVDFAKKVYER